MFEIEGRSASDGKHAGFPRFPRLGRLTGACGSGRRRLRKEGTYPRHVAPTPGHARHPCGPTAQLPRARHAVSRPAKLDGQL
ncbi:Hypp7513 [Branchiostoma lanceolatum]|uniref:Hypp7513 protein n=1 Tax=Branchiostoma lanceolatum TaxID=7740 RepID=A0A8J9Z117_BRALA|nr:Hypp7513 [Branchiostoma lanceolatum]